MKRFKAFLILREMILMGLVLDSALKHPKQMHCEPLSEISSSRE